MEARMFKVFKLVIGGDQTVLSGSVPSKAEAITLAEAEVAPFEYRGYNDEHGFFWGRNDDNDQKQVRVWVER
jgi:hypothetical protein